MSPARKTRRRKASQRLPQGRRVTDVSQLQFSTQMVVVVVSTFLAAAGAVWAGQASMKLDMSALKSDVRDIITNLQNQKEVAEIEKKRQEDRAVNQAKLQDERDQQLREAVESIKRDMKLQQIEFQSFRETMLTENAKRSGGKR